MGEEAEGLKKADGRQNQGPGEGKRSRGVLRAPNMPDYCPTFTDRDNTRECTGKVCGIVRLLRWSYRFGRSWIGCLLQWGEVRQVEEGVGLGEELIDGEEKGVKREEG